MIYFLALGTSIPGTSGRDTNCAIDCCFGKVGKVIITVLTFKGIWSRDGDKGREENWISFHFPLRSELTESLLGDY